MPWRIVAEPIELRYSRRRAEAGRVCCAKQGKRRGEVKQRRWPLSQRPGFLIRRLHQIHVALFQEACGKFDVTPLQYSLLSALAARKTADQTTLAADIALDRTTTTGALKRPVVPGRLIVPPLSRPNCGQPAASTHPLVVVLSSAISAANVV